MTVGIFSGRGIGRDHCRAGDMAATFAAMEAPVSSVRPELPCRSHNEFRIANYGLRQVKTAGVRHTLPGQGARPVGAGQLKLLISGNFLLRISD